MNGPLVSIFCFCKDRVATMGHCIDSVLGQTYRNLEFVIQDGASTDGTLELIQSYKDPRIKLVSEKDAGHHEAFLKVMRRCRGDIVGSCLSDEQLLPHALHEAVEILSQMPRVGAITRDGYNVDSAGKVVSEFIGGEFDFVDYLFGRYCPMWVSSFFRRQALLDIGLAKDGWPMGCIEFATWCRLATQSSVKYVPGIVAKYGVQSEGQLSNSPSHFNWHLESRIEVIERLFSEDGFFGEDKIKKTGCLYNQLFLFYNHARAYGQIEEMKRLYARMMGLERTLEAGEMPEYGVMFSDFGATLSANAEQLMKYRSEVHARTFETYLRASTRLPRFVKQALTAKQRAVLRRVAMRALYKFNSLARSRAQSPTQHSSPPSRHDSGAFFDLAPLAYSKRIYHDVAMLYYARGNIDYAEQLWKKAEGLNDAIIDSLAVQAALFSPTATNESLLEGQRRWATRHAKPMSGLPKLSITEYSGRRQIRVGYFCSFMDSDVFRAMFAPVVQAHDRERFTAVGYSVTPAARHLASVFDEFNVVGKMPDRDFVGLVRSQEIDIFVEMSGFSPLHRFSAMASRCAPIQVAYFNHTGTSGVPNVDYVLADAMSVLPEEDRFFTERVCRLDGDFLFFNYDWAGLPEPADPPFQKNGFITFGCFGSAGKLSDQVIELWAGVLHAVPSSRMYIRNSALGREVNREYLKGRFQRSGIPASRLWLEGATDWHKFIGAYADVDISLDTWPYCGANTIGESVWQGVPVVTLRGSRFSSRYGASHVAAAGTPELIGETAHRYIKIAAELARTPQRILRYRRNLRKMAVVNGLADPARFAEKLEKAFAQMMNNLHDGRGH